jgi:hypothetical protein
MKAKIAERVAREAGVADLPSILSERTSPSELRSLLLHAFSARAARVTEGELVRFFEAKAAVHPSAVDARVFHAFEAEAYAAASAFEAVDLAPVVPFGLNHALGGIDQANVATTIRGFEVLADPTVALALVAAGRRRAGADPAAEMRFCASARLLRLQPIPDIPGFTPHFRLFCLVTAGRASAEHGFETSALAGQLEAWLTMFDRLSTKGYSFGQVSVELADTEVVEALLGRAGIDRGEVRRSARAHDPSAAEGLLAKASGDVPRSVSDPAELSALVDPKLLVRLSRARERVFAPLAARFPAVRFHFAPLRLEGLGYYAGLRLRLDVTTPDGAEISLGDGGFTPWTARLLSDRRERFLATGIGHELACKILRAGGR